MSLVCLKTHFVFDHQKWRYVFFLLLVKKKKKMTRYFFFIKNSFVFYSSKNRTLFFSLNLCAEKNQCVCFISLNLPFSFLLYLIRIAQVFPSKRKNKTVQDRFWGLKTYIFIFWWGPEMPFSKNLSEWFPSVFLLFFLLRSQKCFLFIFGGTVKCFFFLSWLNLQMFPFLFLMRLSKC